LCLNLYQHCFKPTREEVEDRLAGAAAEQDSECDDADTGDEAVHAHDEFSNPPMSRSASMISNREDQVSSAVPAVQALRASLLTAVFIELGKQGLRLQQRGLVAAVDSPLDGSSGAEDVEQKEEENTIRPQFAYIVGNFFNPHNVRSTPEIGSK
jgi:hypothetical protein